MDSRGECMGLMKHEAHKKSKKLVTFIIGCLLAYSYLGMMDIGIHAEVPSSFHGYPDFIVNYYHSVVIGIFAIIVASLLVMFMPKLCRVQVSDHIAWLILPSCILLTFAIAVNHILLMPLISAEIPALLVIWLGYFVEKRDMFLPERLKVW
ncbi:hypothetical protein [Colwellia sp. MEBiC06753]